jgi:hypothetical protein
MPRRPQGSASRITFDPKLMASICALPGNGKTEFGAGCPGPIEYFTVDSNTAEILIKHQDTKDIRLHSYIMPPVTFGDIDTDQGRYDIKTLAQATLDALVQDIRPILAGTSGARTVVLDTATEFFELALLADHGKAVQILPEMRTKTNYKWKSFLQALKGSGCHVILLHLLGPKYESRTTKVQGGPPREERVQVPGEYDRRGFSQTQKEVNVEAFIHRDLDRGDGDLEDQFGIQIVKCNPRPLLTGKQYWGRKKIGRAASFQYLASKLYPEIDDWETR